MNRRFIVAILLVAAVPAFAQAQKPSAVTRADAQRVLKTISGDKAKTRTYCDIAKLVNKITEGDEEQTDGLYEKIDELGKKLGPKYAALMDRLQEDQIPRLFRKSIRCSRRSTSCVRSRDDEASKGVAENQKSESASGNASNRWLGRR